MKTLLLFVCLVLTASAAHIPKPGEYVVMARTGSMYPTFKGGEVRKIVAIRYEDLRPGMIAVSVDKNSPFGTTSHRVIRVTHKYYATKGDANRLFDPLNKPSALVGVVEP